MKKNLKKAGALMLATTMMASVLTGCGNSSSAPVAESNTETEAKEEIASDEVVKLRVWGFGYTATSEDCEAVAEAVNEITRDKIGVEIELVRNSDSEKLNLALTSGEQLDLVNYHTYTGGLSALVNNKMALPIDDLVQEYGQDALKCVGEKNLVMGTMNGTLYSIPSLTGFANGYGMAMRLDVLEELGIDPATIKTIDDIHDVLLQVKEKRPDLYPLVPTWGGGGMQKILPYDNLGTGFLDACGVLENVFDDSTTVVNLYETDAYKEFCERMYQWNQEGLIMPDATTTNDSALCATVGFADWENNTPNKISELRAGWGHDAVVIPLVEPYVNSSAGGDSFFIPTVSKYPEKAMQLWNLMYSDPEVATLLLYGIEGVNYEYTDDSKTYVRATENNTYDTIQWGWPNAHITPVLEGDDADKWEQVTKFDESSTSSPALGFKFDTVNVNNELTACGNVISKYDVGLRWGILNPDEALPRFNEELKAAGIDTIIAEKQAQLDKFLEENK